MMEAAGIEPASESGLPKASTMLSSRFALASRAPMSGIPRGQPRKVSALHPPAWRRPYPDLRRLSRPYGHGPVRRWLRLGSQGVFSVVCS